MKLTVDPIYEESIDPSILILVCLEYGMEDWDILENRWTWPHSSTEHGESSGYKNMGIEEDSEAIPLSLPRQGPHITRVDFL